VSEFASLLSARIQDFISLTGDQLRKLEQHYELLERWNRSLNLTAVRTQEQAVVRHYAESIFLAIQIRNLGRSCTAVDIGSGAGFPGFPVAIVLPEWHVSLVESHQRKAVFLQESARGIDNICVVAKRFEAVPGPFDVGLSRAVAWQTIKKLARSRVRHVALLAAIYDSPPIMSSPEFVWGSPTSPPWDKGTVVLVGCST
jgi:16S rRNA (guanine(527)-N(7))-methyltransferase RsmG